jgi:uncharacterized protein DUF3597
MGLFNNLMSKIFGHATTGAATSPAAQAPAAGAEGGSPGAPASAGGAATATAAAPPVVDVGAILDGLAAKNSEKLDWKRSIVDLMKLVGMDSSLNARKELAKDLHYSGDMNDSATMNVWLHQEVLRKLAENGGKVPQDLLK